MLGKVWKKVMLLILTIACLFNVVKKIVQRENLKGEIESTLNYVTEQNKTVENKEEENKTITNYTITNQLSQNQSVSIDTNSNNANNSNLL